ncbi:MAG: signal peptidase I [Bdellovibrionales bacterium]|nr:signal peptidase I [Bdellovibrionales bacterium]
MKLRTVLDHLISIAAALLLVFFVRSSFYESYKIPSGSMIPTILIGDHVFVNKFAYRFNLPFSEYFGRPIRLFERAGPERGDIVVFESPRNPEINYIKRVIGLPGDTVRVRDRKLYVNDVLMPSAPATEAEAKRIFSDLRDPRLGENEMQVFREKLDGHDHWIFLDRNNFVSESFGPYSVPEGKIFVMGDNRDFSDDSRFIGAIPIDRIRGRASWIWLSIWLQFDPFELVFHPLRSGHSLYSI